MDATAEQDQCFATAFSLIRRAIAERVFPGAALAVAWHGQLLVWKGFGHLTYDPGSPEVRRETVWDLASLTKPIATTSVAMLCVERGLLALDAPVVEYLPDFCEVAAEAAGSPIAAETQRAWRQDVTVAMLLAHSSGLPAHRRFYLEAAGREAIQDAARRLPLQAQPGTRAEYSDIGFIVIGELLERMVGERLNRFCRRELFHPLDLNLRYLPLTADWTGIPPTVKDEVYRHKTIQGEVNDENAWAMGGVAGHAGLFGGALSVARFAECILRGGGPLFRKETVDLFTRRQSTPTGSSRTLGWDTPSMPSQSGTMFSVRSFGHLGYTGTSLWCDAERQLSVTLLTNRTWPDARNQGIKQLRPQVHDAIVAALQ